MHRPPGRTHPARAVPSRAVTPSGALFGDPVLATPILDRLLHHSCLLTMARAVLASAGKDMAVEFAETVVVRDDQ